MALYPRGENKLSQVNIHLAMQRRQFQFLLQRQVSYISLKKITMQILSFVFLASGGLLLMSR